MIILRNSFMIIENKYQQVIEKLQLSIQDLFQSTLSIQNQYAQKNSSVIVSIEAEQLALQNLYKQIGGIAGNIDITLANHTEALLVKANKKLADLEKKMLKAARNKNEAVNRQIENVKNQLFPANNLQERVENIILLYAKYGPELIGQLYQHAGTIQQHFTVLNLQ
jgi:bacillithiol synthase